MPVIHVLGRSGLFELGPFQTGRILPGLAFGGLAIDKLAEALIER